jgi:hypothetical protein
MAESGHRVIIVGGGGGKLKKEHPDAWVNTHVSENLKEMPGSPSTFPTPRTI